MQEILRDKIASCNDVALPSTGVRLNNYYALDSKFEIFNVKQNFLCYCT